MSDLLLLPDLKTIEPPQENESDMMFKVEATFPPVRCPQCGFDRLYKHTSRKQLIMDLPIRLKRVGLQLNRRRYKWGPERLVGICIDKGYKFPLNQCFKAYLFFIFNSLKCLGIDNKSNLYSPRKVICSQLIGDTCFIYLVTSGSILTR